MIIANIIPDKVNGQFINFKDEELKENSGVEYLDFLLLKIISKVSKLGKDGRYIYDILDRDSSGTLDPDELFDGLNQQFNIYYTPKEISKMVVYLDANKSGDLDYQEFSKKVNFGALQTKINSFTITKLGFIHFMLEKWEEFKAKEIDKIMEVFEKFDDNGDGVLVF
mmetsp:Transcript_11993/g.11869  ORF Transcript_11993/g.11869 Transcript_11993/m.11869 type:complete len:167 (-) Transcript_11993:288-788(-)